MALLPGHINNFETLKRAFRDGNVALVECKDATTGEYRAVICAMEHGNGEYEMKPFGHLCNANPYFGYVPPLGEAEKD